MSEAERWATSAEVYAAASPRIPYYAESSQQIARMATDIRPATLMSLGCGSSGMLEALLLSTIPELTTMYCIDISRAMLQSLQLRISDARVSYLEWSADELLTADLPLFDCIVCSSALWLFDLERALPAISAKLQPGGSLLFSIAEWDLADFQPPNKNEDRYRLIDEELLRRGLKPKPNRGSATKLRESELRRHLHNAGMEISASANGTSLMTGANWREFYSIPAIATRSLPHIDHTISLEVLRDAMSQIGESNLSDALNWQVIRCTRRSSQARK